MIAIGIVVGLYLAACVLGRLVYRSLLYPAPLGRSSAAPPSDASELWAETGGPRAHGWLFAHGGETLIVKLHGNGETIDDGVDTARELVARGFDVLLIEYPGYGSAPGAPTESALYAAADALIVGTHVAPEHTVIWGTSLGTGVATEMANRGKCRALVLMAPFTSIPDIGQRVAVILPVGLIVADKFDSRSKARTVHVPVLVIHGTADEVVPYDMGVTLSMTFPHASLMTIQGGHHNDLLFTRGDAIYDAIASHAAR